MNRLLNWLTSQSTLTIAVVFSLGVHVGLLLWWTADPVSFNRFFNDAPLEVILVNAKSSAMPDQAQAYAQHNLVGGGEADKGLATSPLPSQLNSAEGDAVDEANAKVDQLQLQQEQMLATIRRDLAAASLPRPEQQQATPEARAERERHRQRLELFAAIEKRISEENRRPKRRYLGPSTRESAEAMYYDQFRTRIERAGTQNFPMTNGRKLYGELVMVITLSQAGEVLETEIAQSSGNRVLDRRAEAIARATAPFGLVPPQMRRGRDVWVVISRFTFSPDAGFRATTTTLGDRQP